MAAQEDAIILDKDEQIIIDEFIENLEETLVQAQQLLAEIRQSKKDLAQIKSEFEYIVENVKHLSILIKERESTSTKIRLAVIESEMAGLKDELRRYITQDTEGGATLNTKAALIEQRVEFLSKYMDSLKNKNEPPPKEEKAEKAEEANATGKWQFYVAIAGGAFTLLGSIIALLMSMWGK